MAFNENRHRRLSSCTPHMSESVVLAGRSSAEPRLPVRPPRPRDPGPQELPGDPWPRAGERRLGERAWLGLSGLFEIIASPTPSRKAPAPRVWLKSEKLQWGTAATSQNGRGAKSDYNAAGLPRAPRFTLKRPSVQGSHTPGLYLGGRTRLIVL